MEIPEKYKTNLFKALICLIIILSLYYAVRSVSEFKAYRMMYRNYGSTISFSGHGEVQAVPDIANVYFSIRKESKTVKEAQDGVALIEKKSLDFLKENKIDAKDIKTVNASFSPKYEYKYNEKERICTQYSCPPFSGKNVIVGYEASEDISVKVRNTDDVGKIMQGLGAFEVSELSGPNFTIDNEDGLKAEARKKAIDDAKEKAKVLAKDLGIRLGTIVTFSESGGYPIPMYYNKAEFSYDSAVQSAPAEIPKGENTISSDVTITYEIK